MGYQVENDPEENHSRAQNINALVGDQAMLIIDRSLLFRRYQVGKFISSHSCQKQNQYFEVIT